MLTRVRNAQKRRTLNGLLSVSNSFAWKACGKECDFVVDVDVGEKDIEQDESEHKHCGESQDKTSKLVIRTSWFRQSEAGISRLTCHLEKKSNSQPPQVTCVGNNLRCLPVRFHESITLNWRVLNEGCTLSTENEREHSRVCAGTGKWCNGQAVNAYMSRSIKRT